MGNLIFIMRIAINFTLFILLVLIIYYLIHIGNQRVFFKKQIRLNRKYYSIFFLIFLLILIFLIIYYFRSIIFMNLKPIIWAIVFSYLLNPIVNKLMNYRFSRVLSVTMIYLLILIFIILITFTVTPRVSKEIRELVDIMPTYTNIIFNFIDRIYDKIISMDNLPPEFIGVEVALREYLNRTQIFIIDFFRKITEKGLGFFSNIVSIVLIPIYTFYFLKDSNFFKRKIILTIPTKIRNDVISMARDIDYLISNFIRGQLIVAGIVGILSIAALMILDINFAFLIGTIAGLMNIIPYFGPIIGAIPAVVVALLDEPIKSLWVILAFFIIQQIESAILSPKIVGDSVGLHPVFVILALLVGGQLFGLAGLLFAIPVSGSIKIIIKHIAKKLIKL